MGKMKNEQQLSSKQRVAYLNAYDKAQAGGMNNTDSHEFALDHATRESNSPLHRSRWVNNEVQSGKSVVARLYPRYVSDPLNNQKRIFRARVRKGLLWLQTSSRWELASEFEAVWSC